MYRLFVYIYKSVVYLFILFYNLYFFVVFAGDNVQIDSENNFLTLILKKNDFISTRNYTKISFDHATEKINKEVVVINASSYLPLVSMFALPKFLSSSYVIDAADYLKNIPGFAAIRSGGANADLVFRGMFGSRIRILVDNGEILGACCSRMDPPSAYIYPGTFDILNLIKGPQTVLLGPVSSGGTLQFERYHPRFNTSKIELHSNVLVGSNNRVDKNIDSIIGNKYGYIRLMGNVSHSDDYRDGNGCRVYSAWHKWNTDAVISLNFSSNTSYEISVGQGNGRANYANKVMDGLCFARESYSMKIETIDISNTLDKIELYVWYNYMNHIMGNTLSIYNTSNLLCNKRCSEMSRNIDRRIWGARGIIINQWKNVECHSGVDVQTNQHRKRQHDDAWCVDIFTKDVGIFSELILNTFSNRKFIGGIRLEHYNVFNINNDVICRKYSTIYPAGFIRYEDSIHPLLYYYVGIGISKRFPDYWELFDIKCKKNTNEKFNFFSQALKPEQATQIDTGVHFRYLKINGWMSSYIGYIKDFILYNYNNTDEITSSINCVHNIDAKICGTEAELNYQLNNNWCITSNVAWAYGLNVNNGCLLPKIPPVEGILTFKWKYGHCNNVNILWRLVASSKFDLKEVSMYSKNQRTIKSKNCNTIIETPGFGILSVNWTWTGSKYHKLIVGIDNICNKNYKEYLNLFNYKHSQYSDVVIPIYEPGRVWWLRMEIML